VDILDYDGNTNNRSVRFCVVALLIVSKYVVVVVVVVVLLFVLRKRAERVKN
jgi:heme/copper-type cytochrome/quinol oxidase subunit 2